MTQLKFVLIMLWLSISAALAASQTEPATVPTGDAADDNGNTVRVLLLPAARATLSSQMNANLVKLPFETGERFHKGDRLAMFDCSVLQQELRKANAELDIAKANHESNKKLLSLQSVSKLELQISAAEVKKAQAQVGVVAARNRYCNVRAPYDGYVVKRHVNEHENVSQGQQLLDIVSGGKPEIQMFVPSKWIAWLKTGTPFNISIDETQQTYATKVLRLVGQVDPVSQTVEVHAEFTTAYDDLLPGMSGQAIFELPK